MSVTLRTSTVNVQNFPDMSDPNVRADVSESMSISDLVLWQELGESADHKAVNDLDAGWATTQVPVECAISGRLSVLRPVGPAIKTRISNFLGAGSHSPARDMIEQQWTWTTPTGLPDVWSIDIHYVNQAWGTKDVPKKAQRKVEWNNGHAIHKTHALAARAAGYIVLGGGDWNRVRQDIPLFHATQQWITPGPGGLDHIYVLLPAGITCGVTSTWSKDINSDHPLKGAALRLTAAAAPAPTPPEVTVPASVATAEARAAKQSSSGPKFGVNECKQRVRELYSVPSDGAATAAIAWGRTDFKHAIPKDLSEIPDGAIIWWTGGSPTKNHPEGAGHVTKKKNGKNVQCWSTDIKRTGFFDAYNIADISKKWPKLKLAGWSEDIDGVRVITVKPGTVTAPPPVKARDKMNPASYFLGVVGPHVTWLGQRLVAHGYGAFYKSGPGPTFTGTDQKAVAAFQKRQGWTGADADGLPGMETLTRLAAAPAAAAPARPTVAVGGALRIDGTDWSHHQAQKIDYPRAKGAGMKFIIHKATEGETFKDPRYATRRAEAKRAGVPFGAYHFARPDASNGDGADEARFFLASARPQPGDLVPSLDLEDRAGIVKWKIDQHELTVWVSDFVGVIRTKLGVTPIIYTPFDLDDNFGCPLWVARYHDKNAAPRIPAPWQKATIRQFSNGVNGSPNILAGVGHVDLNTLVGVTVDQLRIPAK